MSEKLAYVVIANASSRARILDDLRRQGWVVIEKPTGFHLLQAIADVIDGTSTQSLPALIVVDEFARGCSGRSIADGLRDLGVEIPIVLHKSEQALSARWCLALKEACESANRVAFV